MRTNNKLEKIRENVLTNHMDDEECSVITAICNRTELDRNWGDPRISPIFLFGFLKFIHNLK